MIVYLLHFLRPYGTVRPKRHYLGRTSLELEERLERHRKGKGARLLKAVIDSGNDFVVARTWPDLYNATKEDIERLLKRRYSGPGGYSRICPICLVERELGGKLQVSNLHVPGGLTRRPVA